MNGISNRSISDNFSSLLFALLCAIWKENDFHSPFQSANDFPFSFFSLLLFFFFNNKIQRITGIMNLVLFESWHKIRQRSRWITLFWWFISGSDGFFLSHEYNICYKLGFKWSLWAYIHLNIHNSYLTAYASYYASVCPWRPYTYLFHNFIIKL